MKNDEIADPGNPTALPASLSPDTIRRIFKTGRAAIKPYVWEKRRYPFLAGDFVVFPVFLEDRKTLGFFVYDLFQDRFSPVTLALKDIPEEFRGRRFSDLGIPIQDDGTLLLVGHTDEGASIAAPVTFIF